MAPEGAFRVHCLLLGLVLIAGAILTPPTALLIGALTLVGGSLAALAYYVPIATAARTPWRRRRDRLAVLDWLTASALPLLIALLLASTGHVHLARRPHELTVLLVGFSGGGLAAIVLSGTIDWYLVLPRIAGMLGEPPCRSSLSPRWKWVTIGWYLHRALAAVATIVGATGALIVIATYLLGHVDEFIAGEIIAVMGLIAASYKFRLPTAGMLVLNPRVHVGDTVLYRSLFDEDPIEAYVVDVSLEAVKLKDVKTAAGRPEFFRKETATVSVNKIDDYIRRRSTPYQGCLHSLDGCAGINWYCQRNEAGS